MPQINILTTETKIETLILSPEQHENLKREMKGEKLFIEEYKTIKGKILTDIEIQSILS